MKVLISQEFSKGTREGTLKDFHFTIDGELLTLPTLVCEGGQLARDRCGCGRAFSGVDSTQACTVAAIAEMDETEAREKVLASALVEGWGSDVTDELLTDFRQLCDAVEEAGGEVGQTCRIASTPTRFALVMEGPDA